MKKNILAGSFLIAVLFLGGGSLWPQSPESVQAGVAAAVKGEVKAATPPEKNAHALKSGDKVFMGDTIETGADGQLQILLLDQTVFTLGPSSGITVDAFVYDPKTDDGKVKARMLKGIFRVVSGKVAHKKPESMSVDLPAGSIGFRGTNVAGIIDGSKSTIVLLGPVGVGRIFVTNIVNGEVVAVDIHEAGYATIVDGPNIAPVPVFQVSETDLNRIAEALGQKASGSADTTQTPGMDGNSNFQKNVQVDTQALMDFLNKADTLNRQSVNVSQDAKPSESSKKENNSGSKYP